MKIYVFMSIFLTLFLLLTDIPQELYRQYCTEEVVDSVHTACVDLARIDYKDDVEAGTAFLMADWAFNENLINLSAHQIKKALDSNIGD